MFSKKMRLSFRKKLMLLWPFGGMVFFAFLSFCHDGFRTDRSLQSYYLPLAVGFIVALTIGLMKDHIEEKSRSYERRLSKEREDAALGRSAAAIAHEVRNPLNALCIGLQRLQIEAEELSPEHRRLVDLMSDAVRRANGIVSGLLSYARPQKPKQKTIRLDLLVEDILNLYLFRCREIGIQVSQNLDFQETILGDPDLLGQVVENMLRNALEAQPRGGFIDLELKPNGHELVLKVRNGGFSLTPKEVDSVLEPYFTTKSTGTGLGLPIARRIVEAHMGRLEVRVAEQDTIEVVTSLPLTYSSHQISSEQKGSASS